jgi:hypothetical protein
MVRLAHKIHKHWSPTNDNFTVYMHYCQFLVSLVLNAIKKLTLLDKSRIQKLCTFLYENHFASMSLGYGQDTYTGQGQPVKTILPVRG